MSKFIYGIIIFIGLFTIFFIWNNYQISITTRPDPAIILPTSPTQQCGLENCHGLNPTCGSAIPKTCNMIYQAGDNCRQLINCQLVDNACQLVASPEFDACKSCVENCEQRFGTDVTQFFECENKCGPDAWFSP